MSENAPKRRLVVNADDFGRSESINEAVIRAHTEGILTTASLMVNESAAEEAVHLAKEHPRLGVGLHLALVCGKAALPPEKIPRLAEANGQFSESAVGVGFKYFSRRKCRAELEAENCRAIRTVSRDRLAFGSCQRPPEHSSPSSGF